jgi:hypothetical protein
MLRAKKITKVYILAIFCVDVLIWEVWMNSYWSFGAKFHWGHNPYGLPQFGPLYVAPGTNIPPALKGK